MFIADNLIFLVDYAIFFSARSIALKEFYLMMNFEKKTFYRFKITAKCKFDGQTLIKFDFLEGRLPNFFSGNMFFWW